MPGGLLGLEAWLDTIEPQEAPGVVAADARAETHTGGLRRVLLGK